MPSPYLIVIGGDSPLISKEDSEDFVVSCQDRFEEDVEMYVGVASRRELKEFIEGHQLQEYGEVKENLPKNEKNGLRKFGLPLMDDVGLCDKGGKDAYMFGNMYIVNTEMVVKRGHHLVRLVNRLYALRRGPVDPRNWVGLRKYLPEIAKGEWKVSEAESYFKKKVGINARMILVHPRCALDVDATVDQLRAVGYLLRKYKRE